ncbi:hypothetical protein EMCG_02651 [[Emmonsia] crescens]|uniref:Uncharacterized protein n=1 Tax=[Emmonsia] crescens TaxID=73230 RepID=A0A0G2J8W5_9EURO|nr:hypothetical protein EMCG_02651 [Emmonsia crescens UAMH 3008]
MAFPNESSQEQEELCRESWPILLNLPPLLGPTVPTIGHRFFIHSPSTILKLGTNDGEGIMTALAHSILGLCVPCVICVITVSSRASDASMPTPAKQGLILTRQPGTPLVKLWPSLTALQCEAVKAKLCDLLVHMRARHFTYYSCPKRELYLLFSEFGTEMHAYCASCLEWDNSRIRALHISAPDTEQAVTLE